VVVYLNPLLPASRTRHLLGKGERKVRRRKSGEKKERVSF